MLHFHQRATLRDSFFVLSAQKVIICHCCARSVHSVQEGPLAKFGGLSNKMKSLIEGEF